MVDFVVVLKVLLGVGELVVVGSVPTLKLGTHLKLSIVVISSSSEFSLKFSSVTVVGASVVEVVVVVVVVLVVLAIGSERTSRRTDPGIGLRLTTLLVGGRVTRGACVVLVVEGSVVISSGSEVVVSSMVVVVGASVVVEVEVTGDDSSKSLSRLLIVFGELLCLAPVCVKFAH